jgi:hypothetical protein
MGGESTVKQSRLPEKNSLQEAREDAEYAALVRLLPQVLRYNGPTMRTLSAFVGHDGRSSPQRWRRCAGRAA